MRKRLILLGFKGKVDLDAVRNRVVLDSKEYLSIIKAKEIGRADGNKSRLPSPSQG